MKRVISLFVVILVSAIGLVSSAEVITSVAAKEAADCFLSLDDEAVVNTEGDIIELTSYKPNELRYKSNAAQPRVAVFSEIYFPWGWHVTIDGKEVKEARANYVLRALNVPAGEHEIVFRFDPQSLAVTEGIAFASIGGIFILLIVAAVVTWRKRKAAVANIE